VTMVPRLAADMGTVRQLPGHKNGEPQRQKPPKLEAATEERHRASVFATLGRCMVWLMGAAAFLLGILLDKALRRDSTERRARRLHRLFQRAGGTLIKIGQQLAIRIDFLPQEYCTELSKLHDAVTPFPTSHALAAIERATGTKLDQTFASFDPKPIGAASIACVYQAVLKTGERVAIKVRRPRIGEIFASDLRALRWIVRLLEGLAIIRPGYMDNFVHEFSVAILEELDFRMEAYHQSIFLQESRHNRLGKKKFFTAPKIYYEYSSREVIVEEFVSGVWMWELLAAVESNDQPALARMKELEIEPKLVARRLFWMQLWGQLASPLYHADPHPANILVQRKSKLVFVDFGACASMNQSKKRLSMDYIAAHARKDIGGVVRSLLAFMEPFPNVDMHKVMKDLEMSVGAAMHRVWSKRAPWYEKTSATVFYRLFAVTQKYRIPVNLDTVRSFRANMLYDTLAVRIHPELNPLREIRRFLRDYERNLEAEASRAIRHRVEHGLITGADVAMARDLVSVGVNGVRFLQRQLEGPLFDVSKAVKKSAYCIAEVIKLVVNSFAVTCMVGIVISYLRYRRGLDLDLDVIFTQTLTNGAWYVILGMMLLITVRRINIRLTDLDL
jgi:ubiquinone biosynthesis protein